jgi:NADH-quinone oxidoreductase subunit C
MNIFTPIPANYGDSVTRFSEMWKSQLARLQDRFPGAVQEVWMPQENPLDVPVVFVKKESIIGILSFMKTESGFEYNFLADLTAIDEAPADPQFEIVYNLYSLVTKARIRLKVRLREGEEIATAIPVWAGADWAEREIWDMFGIKFTGHPDLRRILMDERWQGHPLRKDYPLRGYQIFAEPEQINQRLLD